MDVGTSREILSGKSILVVEDVYLVADDIRRALSRVGAKVHGPVPDAATGLRAAREDKLDAAVLDINLSDELSYPIAEELDRRGIPFLFATGYDDWAMPLPWRGVRRIQKPFDVNELLLAVSDVIEGHREEIAR